MNNTYETQEFTNIILGVYVDYTNNVCAGEVRYIRITYKLHKF